MLLANSSKKKKSISLWIIDRGCSCAVEVVPCLSWFEPSERLSLSLFLSLSLCLPVVIDACLLTDGGAIKPTDRPGGGRTDEAIGSAGAPEMATFGTNSLAGRAKRGDCRTAVVGTRRTADRPPGQPASEHIGLASTPSAHVTSMLAGYGFTTAINGIAAAQLGHDSTAR